ncbi:Uclacyanin 1 [Camellia lanceoleosa]|uniref:Uclacyanin 1 n=1 Tax=Camellia lanceoleosa TaxID=1840588 RepID=A0ACC0FYR8_9ERIC|nr:Uclacyanin 1 [Camellia lanceoleosa]
MASNNFLVILAIVAVVLPSLTMATEYWVGDSSGWTINYDYQAWAKDKVFYVGDKLVFNYTMGNHNVFKVNATGFSQCIIPPSNEALTSGHDIIPLMVPGKKWYICGVGQHCAQFGQKLVINVEGGAPAPAPMKNSAHGILNSGHQFFMAAVLAVAAMIVA